MLRQPGPLACRTRMPRPVTARVAALDRVVALLKVRFAAAVRAWQRAIALVVKLAVIVVVKGGVAIGHRAPSGHHMDLV